MPVVIVCHENYTYKTVYATDVVLCVQRGGPPFAFVPACVSGRPYYSPHLPLLWLDLLQPERLLETVHGSGVGVHVVLGLLHEQQHRRQARGRAIRTLGAKDKQCQHKAARSFRHAP